MTSMRSEHFEIIEQSKRIVKGNPGDTQVALVAQGVAMNLLGIEICERLDRIIELMEGRGEDDA